MITGPGIQAPSAGTSRTWYGEAAEAYGQGYRDGAASVLAAAKGYVVLSHFGDEYPTLDSAGMWKTRGEAEADRESAEGECVEGERFTIGAVTELAEARDIAATVNLPADESEAER